LNSDWLIAGLLYPMTNCICITGLWLANGSLHCNKCTTSSQRKERETVRL